MMLRHRFFPLLLLLATLLVHPAFAQQDESTAAAAEKQKAEKQEADSQQESKPDSKEADENDADEKDAKAAEKKPGLRQINLSGNYVDLVQPASFNPTQLLTGGAITQRSFFRLIDFVNELTKDDEFEYVVFDLSAPFSMNAAQLAELSRHMKQLSDSKKTFAWLENANSTALSVAADCDKIFMADFGGIDMPSRSMQSIFFGDAFDLLGVEASVVRAGNFKGAVEPFVNAKMSPHLRQHNLEMLTSLNDTLVERIARGRGLKKSDVRALQKKRMLLPQEAVEAGLVDKLATFGAMKTSIQQDIGEDIEWVTPKKASKKDMSFFQLMSEIMSGGSGSQKFKKNTIVVLHLDGAIIDGKKVSPGSIVSGPTVALIEKLVDEERVQGAVVRINSPGGSATASEAIRQALLKLAKAKPTVVSMGNVAASGGYWVSCIGTPVYAEHGTITGSIGVFSLKVSAGALMRRIGLHMENITLDDAANAFALDQPWSESDVARMKKMIDMVYDRFLKLVSDARDIPVEQLHDLAGGRVWSGSQALQRNLVDQIGGVDDCIALIARKTDLGEDYSIAHRPIPKTGLDLGSLLGGNEEEIWSNLPASASRWLKRYGIQLRQTRLILNDSLDQPGKPTIWLLLPFEFDIR